ncbi:hypothetical protein EON80_23435 [bacterium]|nr:MAG: hypothetical protein EON80_23435 [bacterium]
MMETRSNDAQEAVHTKISLESPRQVFAGLPPGVETLAGDEEVENEDLSFKTAFVPMSTVAEIEAAIEKLRPDEFAAWVTARRRDRKVKVKEKDIGKVMDKMFAHHAPLLRKLAQ